MSSQNNLHCHVGRLMLFLYQSGKVWLHVCYNTSVRRYTDIDFMGRKKISHQRDSRVPHPYPWYHRLPLWQTCHVTWPSFFFPRILERSLNHINQTFKRSIPGLSSTDHKVLYKRITLDINRCFNVVSIPLFHKLGKEASNSLFLSQFLNYWDRLKVWFMCNNNKNKT